MPIYSNIKTVNFAQALSVPSWEELFFRLVYTTAAKSKSLTTKIGAVLVNWEEKDVFSYGFNGLPRGVNDNVRARTLNREERAYFDVHAECNAILNCARKGRSTLGSFMFTNAMPCSHCCAAIIQAGIKKVVFHKQWKEIANETPSWQKWVESARRGNEMFAEARVEVEEYNQFLGAKGLIDGKVVDV